MTAWPLVATFARARHSERTVTVVLTLTSSSADVVGTTKAATVTITE